MHHGKNKNAPMNLIRSFSLDLMRCGMMVFFQQCQEYDDELAVLPSVPIESAALQIGENNNPFYIPAFSQ